MFGFYYKRKKQLFYYEGTSSYTSKGSESVSRVVSQNSSELLLVKYQAKRIFLESEVESGFTNFPVFI